LFPCAEAKPPKYADTARRVVAVAIPISANFKDPESTIENLCYEITLPKSVTMLDPMPKTQTGTSIVGPQRSRTGETKKSEVYVKFSGEGNVDLKVYGVGFEAKPKGERSTKDSTEVATSIEVDRLPAREQIIVAGTRNQGRTLYFDLKWHDQTTRAGQTDYLFLAEVPKDWIGCVGLLTCKASQNGKVAGRLEQPIGLYLSGDTYARQRVEALLAGPQSATESDVFDTAPAVLVGDSLLGLLGMPEIEANRRLGKALNATASQELGPEGGARYSYPQGLTAFSKEGKIHLIRLKLRKEEDYTLTDYAKKFGYKLPFGLREYDNMEKVEQKLGKYTARGPGIRAYERTNYNILIEFGWRNRKAEQEYRKLEAEEKAREKLDEKALEAREKLDEKALEAREKLDEKALEAREKLVDKAEANNVVMFDIEIKIKGH
jgi:hypothetical protein